MNEIIEMEALGIIEEIINDTRSAFARGLTIEEERAIELAMDYTINVNSIPYELSVEEAQYDIGFNNFLDLLIKNNIIERNGYTYYAEVELVDGYNYIMFLRFDDIIHNAYIELWERINLF